MQKIIFRKPCLLWTPDWRWRTLAILRTVYALFCAVGLEVILLRYRRHSIRHTFRCRPGQGKVSRASCVFFQERCTWSDRFAKPSSWRSCSKFGWFWIKIQEESKCENCWSGTGVGREFLLRYVQRTYLDGTRHGIPSKLTLYWRLSQIAEGSHNTLASCQTHCFQSFLLVKWWSLQR